MSRVMQLVHHIIDMKRWSIGQKRLRTTGLAHYAVNIVHLILTDFMLVLIKITCCNIHTATY